MASSVVIPQDIIDNIIDAVDYRSLETCALVSSSFLLPSRKRLFSSVFLVTVPACQRLHQFLVENPVARSFVRCITICWGYRSDFDTSQSSLISILRLPFCYLKSFSMERHSNWNNYSSELKVALSNITHSPTLETLNFSELDNMPIALLQDVHLTQLTLQSISPLFDGKQSSVALEASRTVVDRCEWKFCYPVPKNLPKQIFLPFMSHLRVFEINLDSSPTTIRDLEILSFMIHSLRVSLSSPTKLEHLKFCMEFSDLNYFDWDIWDAFFDDLGYVGVWKHPDSFATHPSGSRLQRVDIHIRFIGGYIRDSVVEHILDALPLLREKGILFVKATT